MDAPWMVTRGGVTHTLAITDDELVLEGPQGLAWHWEQISSIDFPTTFSAVIAGPSELVLGFANRQDQSRFRRQITVFSDQQDRTTRPDIRRSSPAASFASQVTAVQLLTTPTFPERPVSEVLGLVTSSAVISRNFISDTGSDIKSVLGGRLIGVEKALQRGLVEVKMRLQEEAAILGADAVLAVSIVIAGVNDKAEAIVAAGTAVRLSSAPSAT